MWIELKIEEKTYFYECKVVKNMVKFIIFDLKDSWCENILLSDLLERANDLNKRITFNEYDIEDALTSTESVEARFLGVEEDAVQQRVLKLKYCIHRHPFHFKWKLKAQTEKELREAFTLPLFMVVRGMQQQIEELREVIAKKDKELKQYKEDGAELRITTVATKPFDFVDFDDRFKEVNRISKGFQQLAENVIRHVKDESKVEESVKDLEKTSNAATASTSTSSKDGETSKSLASKKLLNSPRARKRRSWELQHQRMAMKLEARKQKLEYENSQSQTLSDSQPDIDLKEEELADISRSLRAFSRQRTRDLNNVNSDFNVDEGK